MCTGLATLPPCPITLTIAPRPRTFLDVIARQVLALRERHGPRPADHRRPEHPHPDRVGRRLPEQHLPLHPLPDGRFRVLEVGRMHRDPALGLRERFGQRLAAPLQVLQVARHEAHARALLQEAERAGQADALAAAGDENVLVLELEIHRVSLCVRRSARGAGRVD